ncbi:MAG: hypothetical protein ACRDY7_05210 [Acidimicrobiia bacterium]
MWARKFLPTGLAVFVALAAAPVPLASPAAAGRDGPCGPPGPRARSMARLPSGTGEVSGFAASRRRPGVAWMIRDSGHPASLYAVRLRGRDRRPWVRQIPVRGARNHDWEDVAYSVGPDGRGRLWIVESTQSGSAPFIYEVREPDPDGPAHVRLTRRYRYRYPGGNENTEASFFYDGRLVLVTKTSPARLYRFDRRLDPKKVNRPHYVGKLSGARRVSIVRPSTDKGVLVASDHETVTIYEGRGPKTRLSHFTDRAPARRKTVARGDNIEAGDFFPFGSCAVILVSESRNIYRMSAG